MPLCNTGGNVLLVAFRAAAFDQGVVFWRLGIDVQEPPAEFPSMLIDAQIASHENTAPVRESQLQGTASRAIGPWQRLALLGCFVLTVLMILNTQMSGEAMWFWYGNVFRSGAKLYTDLHTALQPLFVLETAAWMKLFGQKIVVYEIPSLIHASVLAWGLCLVLREADWLDWQKAIVLFSSFVFIVAGHSYRFDDYHVLAEAQIVYALLLLLILGRRGADQPAESDTRRKELVLVAVLGIVCGLTFVTRVTDGAALVVASVVCVPFLVRRKVVCLAVLGLAAAGTVVVVVSMTGDTIAAYLSNSIFRAAGSKGGTGSIFAAPFLMLSHTLGLLNGLKKVELGTAAIVVMGAAIARYRRARIPVLIPLQLAFAALLFSLAAPKWKTALLGGLFFELMALLLTTTVYLGAAVVILRMLRAASGRGTWDRREILLLVPILEWASYSAGAAAEPLTNYYAPAALIVLLIVVLRPFQRFAVWADPTLVSLLILLAVSGVVSKVRTPYSWQNYRYAAMFEDREWYRHPTYGFMYIDRDLLHFSERLCADIGAGGSRRPELLSLPYPYPNYFCGTPPWHNYVQTFFDTATRGTIEHMMQELQTDPPRWIVYQRQINIMVGSERLYNHGRPIAQRALDSMIMSKLTSGEWKLVDRSSYLRPDWWSNRDETDWYIIQTRP